MTNNDQQRADALNRIHAEGFTLLVHVAGLEGWQELTLRPGTCCTFYHADPHEEGYSSQEESYMMSPQGIIKRRIESNSRDCDGHHQETSTRYADAVRASLDGIGTIEKNARLDWKKIEPDRVRDEFAEAAGY